MRLVVLLCYLALAPSLAAGVLGKTLEYKHKGQVLEGYLALKSENSKGPGILIAHQWMGLTDYEKSRAHQLAEMGYTVLAADIYGKGERPENRQQAGSLAGKYKSDRGLLRSRMLAALKVLKSQKYVDTDKVAAIGYCFGGTAVLELARSGADLAGVASFHGGLSTPHPQDAKKIKAKVLVLHGADDPAVPPEEVLAFQEEMRKGGVDWQMIHYSGAVHAFTQPGAGNDNYKGAAYNKKADQRSWSAMKGFFEEIFAEEN
jgi:dienelactone hydrolase